MRYVTVTATLAALFVAGTALAQQPLPYQRTMNPELQQAYAAPDAPMPTYRTGVPLARKLPNGTWLDPNGRLQRDRFGNIAYGETCGQHWSNCAFNPDMPMAR